MYFDPRALLPIGADGRAVMHAKCVVVDERWVLVTSANFTEAAHNRNLEAGLALQHAPLAAALSREFSRLLESGALRMVSGLE